MVKTILKYIVSKLGYKIININEKENMLNTKIDKLGIRSNRILLYNSFSYYEKLKQKFPELKIVEEDCGFIISFENLKIYIESTEELFILNEVFIDSDYNFLENKEIIVFDIGMNIGIASLFFASKINVSKIYGFEPVQETYKQAIKNIGYNPMLKDKIETFNFGLAKNNREESFYYTKWAKGNSGIRGLKSPTINQRNDLIKIKIQLKNIVEVFQDILIKNNKFKLLKIDCEGGEYEIIEALADSKLLTSFDVLLIEWHDRGPELIETILLKNNYKLISRGLSKISGMIYAFK